LVSIPSDSGGHVEQQESFTSPASTPPWIAAPIADDLVGIDALWGSSPAVRSRMRSAGRSDRFGKDPHKGVNPDEVVAIGAANPGRRAGGEVKTSCCRRDAGLSLGSETKGGVTTGAHPAHTTIPTKKSEVFSTADDNQTTVEIHVLQGERPMAPTTARSVSSADGLAAAPMGVPQVEVTFDIDANGNPARHRQGQGDEQGAEIRIEASSGLGDKDIDKMVKEAEAHAADDNGAATKSSGATARHDGVRG